MTDRKINLNKKQSKNVLMNTQKFVQYRTKINIKSHQFSKKY